MNLRFLLFHIRSFHLILSAVVFFFIDRHCESCRCPFYCFVWYVICVAKVPNKQPNVNCNGPPKQIYIKMCVVICKYIFFTAPEYIDDMMANIIIVLYHNLCVSTKFHFISVLRIRKSVPCGEWKKMKRNLIHYLLLQQLKQFAAKEIELNAFY